MTTRQTRTKKPKDTPAAQDADLTTPDKHRRARRNTAPDAGLEALLPPRDPYDFPQDLFGASPSNTPISHEQHQLISRHVNDLSLNSRPETNEGNTPSTSIAVATSPRRRHSETDIHNPPNRLRQSATTQGPFSWTPNINRTHIDIHIDMHIEISIEIHIEIQFETYRESHRCPH